jgi:hypothetical protein
MIFCRRGSLAGLAELFLKRSHLDRERRDLAFLRVRQRRTFVEGVRHPSQCTAARF